MSLLEAEGNPNRTLTAEDFDKKGEINSDDGELALVVGSAIKAETYIANKQWALLWRDADLLYQSPRPMSVYENTYVLEPNVQRFTVAKICNSVVPQIYKGLFYEDPPMVLRPRMGVTQAVTDAKTAVFSYMLDACKFRRETKWGLEQMAHLGTGIWKWGIEYTKVKIPHRKATFSDLPMSDLTGENQRTPTDEEPVITWEEKVVPRPFFEHREISRVLVSPDLEVSDIREANFAVDVRYMDYFQLKELQEVNTIDGVVTEGWTFPKDLIDLWLPPAEIGLPPTLSSEEQSTSQGAVLHAQRLNEESSSDPRFKKIEVMEYWDKRKKIIVLDRKKVIYSGDNPFGQIPFLSANWWNRRKAFYGMGLGLIIGQNQRVDQGTINSILKILSFGVNPIYLRRRDANAPTQMIRTGLGKILTVDGEADKAYKLLESPKVPGDIWAALKESETATESASGADQMLVQGSSAGPRSSMGRTAGGAATLASASATRLDGPLDNFIEQVFKPFLYILDYLVFNYISDAEIVSIIGQKMGKDFVVDMQEFHDAQHEYEVLAGASLAAKKTMAQSLTLITQIFENPTIQQNLAEINGEYIDFKPILDMWMEASEWKNKNDIIKPLTPEMKQRMAEKSQAAQQQSKFAQATQMNDQKFQQKQQLDDLANDNRIKRDIVREAFRHSAMSQGVSGEPSDQGLQGDMPTIE